MIQYASTRTYLKCLVQECNLTVSKNPCITVKRNCETPSSTQHRRCRQFKLARGAEFNFARRRARGKFKRRARDAREAKKRGQCAYEGGRKNRVWSFSSVKGVPPRQRGGGGGRRRNFALALKIDGNGLTAPLSESVHAAAPGNFAFWSGSRVEVMASPAPLDNGSPRIVSGWSSLFAPVTSVKLAVPHLYSTLVVCVWTVSMNYLSDETCTNENPNRCSVFFRASVAWKYGLLRPIFDFGSIITTMVILLA